jgi:hypothetical protein
MGGSPKTPKAPTPPVPVVMPVADDDAVAAAKKKKMAQIQGNSGRDSTDLTDGSGSDTLGT